MKRILTILTATLVAILMSGSWAWAGTERPDRCTTETTGWILESPGEGWVQIDERTVIDEEAVEGVEAQHYSLKGNSGIDKDEVPPTPSENPDIWQANTHLEPHYQGNGLPASNVDGSDYVEGDSGLHYTSNESSGKRDWFYFQPEVPGKDAVTHQEYRFEKTTCEPVVITQTLRQHKYNCDGYFLRTVTIKTVDGEVVSKEYSEWVKTGDLTKRDKIRLECVTPVDEPEKQDKPDKPVKNEPKQPELAQTGANTGLALLGGALVLAGSGILFARRFLTTS